MDACRKTTGLGVFLVWFFFIIIFPPSPGMENIWAPSLSLVCVRAPWGGEPEGTGGERKGRMEGERKGMGEKKKKEPFSASSPHPKTEPPRYLQSPAQEVLSAKPGDAPPFFFPPQKAPFLPKKWGRGAARGSVCVPGMRGPRGAGQHSAAAVA